MADFFVMPVTTVQTLQPAGLGTAGDSNSVLFILMLGLGFIVLAVVGMYMMKMMKWA
jgi:hypothetical protein